MLRVWHGKWQSALTFSDPQNWNIMKVEQLIHVIFFVLSSKVGVRVNNLVIVDTEILS